MRKVTVLMIAYFLFVQLAALAVGSRFIAAQVSVVENPADPANAGVFFAYVLFSAIVLLLVLKFYHGKLLFLALEFLLLFFSLQILFSQAFETIPSSIAALLLAGARFALPNTRPLLLLVASAVVGALLGSSLDILPAVLFSALLAGYDVIAVFYTHHMITLARGLSERGAAFSIQITGGEKKKSVGEEEKKTREQIPHVHAFKKEIESIELGTGDLVVPAMLQVSALKLSLAHAAASFAGGVLGLGALFYVLEKQKGYWPALPPIVFGSLAVLGLLQALLFLKVL